MVESDEEDFDPNLGVWRRARVVSTGVIGLYRYKKGAGNKLSADVSFHSLKITMIDVLSSSVIQHLCVGDLPVFNGSTPLITSRDSSSRSHC